MGVFFKKGKWYIDYYANGHRKREAVSPSKRLAVDALRRRQIEVAENRYYDNKPEEPITFCNFATEYLEIHAKPNKKSWYKCDMVALKHLLPVFGNKLLSEITPLMVESYKIEKAKEVSVSSVNRHLNCLRSMYSRAIAWGRVNENPVQKVKFFKEPNHRLRYLDQQEVQKLLSNCNSLLKAIVILALNTGMRLSEVRFLKWQDVDFENEVITLLETKNGQKRSIPLNHSAKQSLQNLPRTSVEYVFAYIGGKPYSFRTAFETALRKSGIKDFRFHDLRHTFASYLAMSGVDLNTIRELLAHGADIPMWHFVNRIYFCSLEDLMGMGWNPGQEGLEIMRLAEKAKKWPKFG